MSSEALRTVSTWVAALFISGLLVTASTSSAMPF